MPLPRCLANNVKKWVRKLGIEALSRWQYEEYLSQRNKLLTQILEDDKRVFDDSIPAECVIFSMNRPVQVHALLTSYKEMVKNRVPVHVLYAATTPEFDKAYMEIAQEFKDENVTFHKEEKFRKTLLEILNSLKASKMFFLVDDIIFTHELDMAEFTSFDPKQVLINIRLAPRFNFSFTRQVKQLPPKGLKPLEGHADKVTWQWDEGGNEWGYPMSVDGHLFDTKEVTWMSTVASFVAPNTYEGALMQFYSYVKDRPGICYTDCKIVNVPCNKVQTENDNVAGEITPESLLEKWNEGLCIDTSKLKGYKNMAPHEETSFEFKQRG